MSDPVIIAPPLPDLPATLAVDNPVKSAWREYQKAYLARDEVTRVRIKCLEIEEAVRRNNENIERMKELCAEDLQALPIYEDDDTIYLSEQSAKWNFKRLKLEKKEPDLVNDMLIKKVLFINACKLLFPTTREARLTTIQIQGALLDFPWSESCSICLTPTLALTFLIRSL